MKDSIIKFLNKEPKKLMILLSNDFRIRQEWKKYLCGPFCRESGEKWTRMEIPLQANYAFIDSVEEVEEFKICININKEYVRVYTLKPFETVLLQEVQECKNNENLFIICRDFDDD